MFWLAVVGVSVPRATEIILEMKPASIVRKFGCTHNVRNGSGTGVRSFLYVAFASSLAKCTAIAVSCSRSSNTASPSVNLHMTHTSLPKSLLYCNPLTCMCVLAFDHSSQCKLLTPIALHRKLFYCLHQSNGHA